MPAVGIKVFVYIRIIRAHAQQDVLVTMRSVTMSHQVNLHHHTPALVHGL